MNGLRALLCGLAILPTVVVGAIIPKDLQSAPSTTPAGLNAARVRRELGDRVSNTTTIFGQDDERYEEATSRWNIYAVPEINVVIEPGEERDVSTIIEYCNENSIDFLALNGGHGNTQSLGSFNGIQIAMAKLREITINPDGQRAWLQGGVDDGMTTEYLWEQGYVTTTGACDCVGLMGAALGGGHGRLEGLYGMASDNLLQLNVVLADGTAIRVNETSHPDLLWAMKGAGHNFGVVTSFEMNIYPRGPDTWHYHNYIWGADKLEAVFEALNALHDGGATPVNMASSFGNFLLNTTISDEEPVLSWTFAYRGSEEEAEPLLASFNDIEAEYQETGDVPYPQVAAAQQTDYKSFICQHGFTRITATAGLQAYNVTAERQIMDGFTARIKSIPKVAAGAVVLHEGYSTEAVMAQDPDASAYPFREDHHLNLIQIIVPEDEGNNTSLQDAAWEWVIEVRDQWNNGQPGRLPSAYVNYANGYEPVPDIYGHESWRVWKLHNLKYRYDPWNQFTYFNPIIDWWD